MALTEAQRAKGRATAAANRAARKAQQASSSSMGSSGDVLNAGPVVSPEDGVDVTPYEVEVKVSPPAPARSLKDRILGRITQPQTGEKPKPKARAGKKQDIAVMQVLPSLASLFIMTIARDRFPDEYKPCAPSKGEVDCIINPLIAIIARRVEVTGQMSQDALDLANSITFMMAYSVRAYCTYVEIKHKEQPTHANQPKNQPSAIESIPAAPAEAALAGGMRAYQGASGGTGGDTARVDEPGPGSGGNNGNGASSELSDKELRDYEAGLVSSMFARDRGGRVRLGLLPG